VARIKVEWLPAVGAARYEVREQGGGDTPIDRYRSGTPLGPRVDDTFFEVEVPTLRTHHLSVRSYNRAGVGSPEPQEITVTPDEANDIVRVPTDLNLVSYWSFDEKYDQTGALMEPQLFGGVSGPFAVGSAEHGRRMRYDQGFSENHMILQDFGVPVVGAEMATSVKESPCNNAVQMGDVDGTAIGRWNETFGNQCAVVDQRVATGGQTDVDLVENFTITGWVNPTLTWDLGASWAQDNGQRVETLGRLGIGRFDGFGLGHPTGWKFLIGGPSWFGGHGARRPDGTNALDNLSPTPTWGLSFIYTSQIARAGSPVTPPPWTIFNAGWCHFWAYDWLSELDITQIGVPPFHSFNDSGEYAGWHFVALRVGEATGTDTVATCDFDCFVGKVDTGDLVRLPRITAPRIRHDLWSHLDDNPPEEILMSVNAYSTAVSTFLPTDYDNFQITGRFARHDEIRLYNRPLVDGEIKGLFYHPGGQKRTENPLELERQV